MSDKDDCISKKMAIDTIMGQPPEPHYPSWYAAQIEKLPAAQPATSCSEIPNGSDDTISRRAAIDLFPDDDLEYDTKGGYVAPHLARRMICELPSAQPKTHWIPCSERMPERADNVIICYKAGDYTLVSTGRYLYKFKMWYVDVVGDLRDGVTAWMPLPEPYRGGEQDDR